MCEHINLPFQAGDDRVLQDMRRGYASEDYRRLVDRIRDAIPGVSMSTDVIVGFPGETDDEFRSTLDLIRDVRFDKVHVAAYSDREGTIAHRKHGGRRAPRREAGARAGDRAFAGEHRRENQRRADG